MFDNEGVMMTIKTKLSSSSFKSQLLNTQQYSKDSLSQLKNY